MPSAQKNFRTNSDYARGDSICSNKKLGAQAESLVCKYLKAQGWTIYARNFARRGFELDIVAGKGHTLICAEVKFRKNSLILSPNFALTELVGVAKIKRLKNGLDLFVQQYQSVIPKIKNLRIDLVLVMGGSNKIIWMPSLHKQLD